mmetsp:Transcript_227/g.1783  ORF Transcript_227/g.1783 Transcript_227/m.1783 type:complete len:240 (+) Transcript_227:2623-3342(+)
MNSSSAMNLGRLASSSSGAITEHAICTGSSAIPGTGSVSMHSASALCNPTPSSSARERNTSPSAVPATGPNAKIASSRPSFFFHACSARIPASSLFRVCCSRNSSRSSRIAWMTSTTPSLACLAFSSGSTCIDPSPGLGSTASRASCTPSSASAASAASTGSDGAGSFSPWYVVSWWSMATSSPGPRVQTFASVLRAASDDGAPRDPIDGARAPVRFLSTVDLDPHPTGQRSDPNGPVA